MEFKRLIKRLLIWDFLSGGREVNDSSSLSHFLGGILFFRWLSGNLDSDEDDDDSNDEFTGFLERDRHGHIRRR